MSFASISLSDKACKRFSSTFCADVKVLELAFFIGPPFVRRSFAGIDDASGFFVIDFLGPCMDNEHDDMANLSDRLPALFFRARVGAAQGQRIIKHELCRRKTQAVLELVRTVFGKIPQPTRVKTFL